MMMMMMIYRYHLSGSQTVQESHAIAAERGRWQIVLSDNRCCHIIYCHEQFISISLLFRKEGKYERIFSSINFYIIIQLVWIIGALLLDSIPKHSGLDLNLFTPVSPICYEAAVSAILTKQ